MADDLEKFLAPHFPEEMVHRVVDLLSAEGYNIVSDVWELTLQELRDIGVPTRVAKKLLAAEGTRASFGTRLGFFDSETYKRVSGRSPSDLAANCSEFIIDEQMKPDKPPVFLNSRPDTAKGLPMALVSPVFANFLDMCKDTQVNRKDSAFVNELCEQSSKAYTNEAARCDMLKAMFKDYLPEHLTVESISNQEIAIYYHRQLLAIAEVKNEEGSCGNAYLQTNGYYLKEAYSNSKDVMLRCGCYPMFLLEITGALFKVSGAAFSHFPMMEPLEIGLLMRRSNREQMDSLCQLVVAFRRSLENLILLRAEVKSHQVELDLFAAKLPYPLQEAYCAGAKVEVLSYGKLYQVDLGVDAPTLPEPFETYKRKGNKNVLVKFCQRYGSQVHADWASRGSAPRLIGTESLGGQWLMVLVELKQGYMDLQHATMLYSSSSVEWHKICDLANKCLERAQASSLLRGVHGDLRLQNLLVDSRLTHVLAVDFERAGIDGIDRYPLFMNHADVKWPDGATDGSPLKQEHDTELLKTELARGPKRKYDWHADTNTYDSNADPKRRFSLA